MALAAWVVTAAPCTAADERPGSGWFHPPQARFAGLAIGSWGGRWWQWLKSFARSNNPVTDRSGALCTEGQVGDVWFLAGAPTPAPVERACTLPAGVTLLFPVLAYVYYAAPAHPLTCEGAREGVAGRVARPVGMTVTLNGEAVAEPLLHREPSPGCFDPLVHTTAEGEQSRAWPGASDGWWFALRPLPPGTHRLHFSARVRGFGQDVTYTLTVLPPDDA